MTLVEFGFLQGYLQGDFVYLNVNLCLRDLILGDLILCYYHINEKPRKRAP